MCEKPYLAALFCLLAPGLMGATDWRPVDPADFALKAPRVEKDASAEALFWEVRLKDNIDGQRAQTELTHYIRIKVFNDKGRDSATAELLYWQKDQINGIAGRTIKPDGTIIEMEKDAIFDKTVVKGSGIKIKAKSFVLPNVAAGDIIEYRWREIRNDRLSNNMRLPLQREIPIERVKYIIKPLQVPYLPYAMRVLYFQAPSNPFQPEPGGFSSVEFQNIPAFHEEENMPPEDTIRLRCWSTIRRRWKRPRTSSGRATENGFTRVPEMRRR